MTVTADMQRRAGECFRMAAFVDGLHVPYLFGGAHGTLEWRQRSVWEHGMDCSSSSSLVDSAGGVLESPRPPYALDTVAYERYGEAGWGALITHAVLDLYAIKANGLHGHEFADELMGAGETHHMAVHFNLSSATSLGRAWNSNARARAAGGWFQFTHTGGPTGFVGFNPAGYHLRHWPGI